VDGKRSRAATDQHDPITCPYELFARDHVVDKSARSFALLCLLSVSQCAPAADPEARSSLCMRSFRSFGHLSLVCCKLCCLVCFLHQLGRPIIPSIRVRAPQSLAYLLNCRERDGQSPYATVDLPKLVAYQRYNIFLDLIVPYTESNVKLGNFMTSLTLTTLNNETVAFTRRPVSPVSPYVCAIFDNPPSGCRCSTSSKFLFPSTNDYTPPYTFVGTFYSFHLEFDRDRESRKRRRMEDHWPRRGTRIKCSVCVAQRHSDPAWLPVRAAYPCRFMLILTLAQRPRYSLSTDVVIRRGARLLAHSLDNRRILRLATPATFPR